MIVVSDTSPLNYLVWIDEIDLLPRMFSRVAIPPAVQRELLHPRAPLAVAAWAANLPPWIDVIRPDRVDASAGLGRGEAEAIAIASQLDADITLIDERKASFVARQSGLAVTGTLGVLDLAAEKGFVDPKAAITRLLGTNFRLSPGVIEAFLEGRR